MALSLNDPSLLVDETKYVGPRKDMLIFGYVRQNYSNGKENSFPDDLSQIFIPWVIFMDSWDTNKSSKDILFINENTEGFINSKEADLCCIGSYIVGKGDKMRWKFHSNVASVFAGIVGDEVVNSKDDIRDFTNSTNKGYAVNLYGWSKYHASDFKSDGLFKHAEQFKFGIGKDYPRTITMELDLTQTENKHGILRMIIHHQQQDNNEDLKIDGEYGRIVYDNIDIDKKYRACCSVSGAGNSIQLMSLP